VVEVSPIIDVKGGGNTNDFQKIKGYAEVLSEIADLFVILYHRLTDNKLLIHIWPRKAQWEYLEIRFWGVVKNVSSNSLTSASDPLLFESLEIIPLFYAAFVNQSEVSFSLSNMYLLLT
jgi:hypothetical protein